MNDILNTLGDIQRRLRRLEALGERPVTSTLDGSGTAGQLATWVTATTLQANTPASLSLTKYTGVGTAGNLVSWASNGTVQDAGVTTAQFVSKNAANTFTALQTAQLADATTLYSVGSVTSMLALRNSVNQSNTSAGVRFRVGNSSDTEQQAYVGFVSVYDASGPKFIVRISTGTASYAEYLSIAPNGLTTVNALTVSGSLSVGGTIRAADTGGLRVMDSGGTLGVYVKDGGDVGIGTATTASGYKLTVNGKVSATAINVGEDDLSAYSESTWTPTITGSTNNPTTLNFTAQTGTYTRIGNTVIYVIGLTIGTIVGGTGDVRVSLPFTAVNNIFMRGVLMTQGVDLSGTPAGMVFVPTASTSYGRLLTINDNASASVVQISGLHNGDQISCTGFYFV